MRCAQHAMFARIDHATFGLRITAPQHEYQAFAVGIQMLDDMVGETFPTFTLMRSGLAVFDREYRIQQQHA